MFPREVYHNEDLDSEVTRSLLVITNRKLNALASRVEDFGKEVEKILEGTNQKFDSLLKLIDSKKEEKEVQTPPQ